MNSTMRREKSNRGFFRRIKPRNNSSNKIQSSSQDEVLLSNGADMQDSGHSSSALTSVSGLDYNDDPVEMMKQLRTLRMMKGFTKGTTKAVVGASRSVVKGTKKVALGTQKTVSRGSQAAVAAVSGRGHYSAAPSTSSEHSVDYDVEAATVTEKDPLVPSDKPNVESAPPRSGAELWSRLRERKDDIVFDHAADDEEETKESVELRKTRHKKYIEKDFRSSLEFTLTHCLMAIGIYLAIAVLMFSFVLENWTIIDSCYFACVSFTTIGYGDIVPSTDASRLFTAFFALSGVACLGVALGVLGSNLVEAQTTALEQASELSQYQVMSLFDSSDKSSNGVTLASSKSRWYHSAFVTQVLPLFTLLFLCCWFLGKDAGWDVITTFYYCVITATTVGYGDFAPTTQTGRLFAVPVILLAVGAMGSWLSAVADAIIEYRQAAFRERFEARELTSADLEVMDADEDGKVTLAEYISFMLVAMQKVDEETIDRLTAQFNRLDVDGSGTLEKEDLVIVAKRKLHSSKRKVELAHYKQQLLRAGEGNSYHKSGSFISAVTSHLSTN